MNPGKPHPVDRSRAGNERDHLFISYAWEDGALAEWLVRKLAAAGYRVWCDRFKILGGERWPRDIDRAIKNRTFRMLGLISEHSIEKPNPSKERQMALTLSRERAEDFYIPLNVDGLAPSSLPWDIADINFIPFQSWSEGLLRLLEKLESINAPRPLGDNGKAAAIDTFLPRNVLRDEEETLYANCLVVTRLPENIFYYSLSRKPAQVEKRALERHWAFYACDDTHVMCFISPAETMLNASVPECEATLQDTTKWRDNRDVHGVNSRHLVSSLIKKSLLVKCVERGLEPSSDLKDAYFPEGLLKKNAISYQTYTGKNTHVSVLGERRMGKGRFRYQLGVSFWLRSDVLESLVVETKVRLLITDPSGELLHGHAANARRKKVTKSWWNHEWVSRQLALVAFLRGTDEEIVVGSTPDEAIHISGSLLEARVSPSINDASLKPLAAKVEAMNQSLADEEDEQTDIEPTTVDTKDVA